MLTTSDISSYYDGWRERHLEDYRLRNQRVVAALDFARKHLEDARTVLDVGCGIGWTTHELATPARTVTGLDISPVLIGTARELWPDLRFIAADFREWEPEPVDAVVMVDVYEHFPRDDRPVVHERLRQTGARRVVMTVPASATTALAYTEEVAQPVDEYVTAPDIHQLAEDLGGRVAINEYVSVWRPDDYRHALLEVVV